MQRTSASLENYAVILTIHKAFLHQANDQSSNVSFLNLEALEMQSIHLT